MIIINQLAEDFFFEDLKTFIGSEPLSAEFSSIMTFSRFSSGSSNITFIKMSSKIDLRPLAPVFLAIARFAMLLSASSLKLKSTESISKRYLY